MTNTNVMDSIALAARILIHLPIPKGENDLSIDQIGIWSVINIKCTAVGLGRAARELGDALLALPFQVYEDLSQQPCPPGVECTFLVGEDGQRLRVMRQYDIVNSRDLFELTVMVK